MSYFDNVCGILNTIYFKGFLWKISFELSVIIINADCNN